MIALAVGGIVAGLVILGLLTWLVVAGAERLTRAERDRT